MDNESAGDTFGVPCHRFQCAAPGGLDFSSCHQSVAPVILNSRSKPYPDPIGSFVSSCGTSGKDPSIGFSASWCGNMGTRFLGAATSRRSRSRRSYWCFTLRSTPALKKTRVGCLDRRKPLVQCPPAIRHGTRQEPGSSQSRR